LAALAGFLIAGLLATASSAAPNPGVPTDAGPKGPLSRTDAGRPTALPQKDGGSPSEDKEVVENLELLEHLQEADMLELLLPVRDH